MASKVVQPTMCRSAMNSAIATTEGDIFREKEDKRLGMGVPPQGTISST